MQRVHLEGDSRQHLRGPGSELLLRASSPVCSAPSRRFRSGDDLSPSLACVAPDSGHLVCERGSCGWTSPHPQFHTSGPRWGVVGVVSLSRHQSNPSPSLETAEGPCPAIQLWAVKWESFEPKSWGQALAGTSPHLSETQFSLPRSRD